MTTAAVTAMVTVDGNNESDGNSVQTLPRSSTHTFCFLLLTSSVLCYGPTPQHRGPVPQSFRAYVVPTDVRWLWRLLPHPRMATE